MNDWILILTFALSTQPGEVRNIAPVILPGFASKALCDAAAESISHRLIALGGRHREQQGTQANRRFGSPAINYECISIRKS
jgi:hypothetical protein